MLNGPGDFVPRLSVLSVLLWGAIASPALASDPPVVVELFTAQGCAACPDANRSVATLSENPDVLVLTYGVDYWDYLGWRDTFARPEFSQRQRDYRQALGLRSLATPQVIVAGHTTVERTAREALDRAVAEQTQKTHWPPEIEFRETGDRVGVGSGRTPQGGADVLVVRYAPGMRTVQVTAGDNKGRDISHANVVREIRHLGEWNGQSALYDLPPAFAAGKPDGEAVVVLVQAREDRRILGVARQPEPRHD